MKSAWILYFEFATNPGLCFCFCQYQVIVFGDRAYMGVNNLPRVTRDWCDCKSAVLRLCHLAALKFPLLLHYTYLTASSRPTRVSQYQKGTARLDLNESGDDGILGYTGISWTICKQSAPRSRQPHQHLSTEFLQAGCSSWHPANSVRALKTLSTEGISTIDNRA